MCVDVDGVMVRMFDMDDLRGMSGVISKVHASLKGKSFRFCLGCIIHLILKQYMNRINVNNDTLLAIPNPSALISDQNLHLGKLN